MDATTGAAGAEEDEEDEDAAGGYAWYVCAVCAGVGIRCVECESESDGCCEPVPRVDGGYVAVRSYSGGVRARGWLPQCPLVRFAWLDEEEDARGAEKGRSCKVGPVRESLAVSDD